MTLIYAPRHVDQLISEIKSEWVPDNDPDMHRVADALPIEVLEKAYLKKLDAEANRPPLTLIRATTPRTKIAVMRKICAAWLRAPHQRLGQLFVNAIIADRAGEVESRLYNKEDGPMADAVDQLVVYTRPK